VAGGAASCTTKVSAGEAIFCGTTGPPTSFGPLLKTIAAPMAKLASTIRPANSFIIGRQPHRQQSQRPV
jgi:hypothetical protein